MSNQLIGSKIAGQKVSTVPLQLYCHWAQKLLKKIIVQLRILSQTTTPTCFNTVYTRPNFFQFTYHRYYIYKELIISMSNTFIMSPVFQLPERKMNISIMHTNACKSHKREPCALVTTYDKYNAYKLWLWQSPINTFPIHLNINFTSSQGLFHSFWK